MLDPLATEALVLRRFDTGEADRVVWLLTPGRGRLSAFAAAARKSQRRFAGAIEPFTRLSVELLPPMRGELFRLQDAQVLDSHTGIRASLEATACASAACELIATLAIEGGKGHGTGYYEVLLAYLRRLSQQASVGDDLYRFLLLALEVTGVRPRFAACAKCGRLELTRLERFDPAEGGRLCGQCTRGQGGRSLSPALLSALGDFERGTADFPLEGRDLLWDFAQYQTGKPVKSLGLLRDLGL